MAIGFFTGSGGGVDTSVVTAEAADVLSGKVIVDANGNPLTGTMPDNGAISQSLGINGSFIIPQGFHNGSGEVFQSISTMGAQTITPSGTAQTVACNGKYMTGNITVGAASVYKTISGVVAPNAGYINITDDSGAVKSVYSWTIALSGFKQVLVVAWSGQSGGCAVSGTDFYFLGHMSGLHYNNHYKSGGIITASKIQLPSAFSDSNIFYWVCGIAS